METKERCVWKKLRWDSMPPIREKRRMGMRGERLQGIAEAALPVWPTHQLRHFLGEMSVWGIIVAWYYRRKEKIVPAREIKVNDKAEWEEEKRMADLLMLPRPAKSLQNGSGFWRKLEQTGPAKKGKVASVPQSEQLARMQELPFWKRKGTEPSVQIIRWQRDLEYSIAKFKVYIQTVLSKTDK